MPAWRSILVLAGAFFSKKCGGEGRKGSTHNETLILAMFIRVHNFTLLAMFVIEFIHLFLGPLSSFPRCPSLFSAICPDFS